MSAKFQTFAYNSRTVKCSCMKFWQQFEINELYVCTKFRGNYSCNFDFMIQKPLQQFSVKTVSVKNGLGAVKSISHNYIS